MIRHLLAAAIVLAPVSAHAVSILQYKGGYETAYTGQTGSECNVATANFCTLGSAFNNGSNKYIRGTAVFTPGSAWTPTGGPLSCWLLESVDGGTNYEVTPTAAGLVTARQPDFSITIMAGTSVTVRAMAFNVILKPGYQKMICYNSAGATIPTSSTVEIYPWSVQQQ
jgi:hypothetical protein